MADGSSSISSLISALPWSQIFADLWAAGRGTVRKFAQRGLYHVLEHESTLEILDDQGRQAVFHKRQKVRYSSTIFKLPCIFWS